MHLLVKLTRVWITAYTSASSLVFDVTTTGYSVLSYSYSDEANVYDKLIIFWW